LQDYDEDLIVMVMDWYHAMSPVQLAWYLSSASYDILTDNYGIEVTFTSTSSPRIAILDDVTQSFFYSLSQIMVF
jgi:hypothetical protein